MDNTEDTEFNSQIINAIDEKITWFNSTALPKVQEIYRNHLILIRNIFSSLQRRSLITADPYKHDKKITDIVCPEETPFAENERNQKLGIRLSDYESMVDYICTYIKFSVDQLPTGKIKKLIEFNNSFSWNSLTPNSAKFNSKALGSALNEFKITTQGISTTMIFEGIAKTANDLNEANGILKQLGSFQKERYKGEIRKTIITKLDANAKSSHDALTNAIKNMMPTAMPHRSFAADIVDELVNEETSSNKAELRKKLVAKLKIQEATQEKKEKGPNLHEIIMSSVKSFGGMAEQYNVIYGKLTANHDLLQASNNTFKQKLLRTFRHLFGLAEPPVVYEVTIMQHRTEQKTRELINYNSFMEALAKRIKFYSSLSATNSPNYMNLNSQKDDFIFNFVNKQITDNGRLQTLLAALDDYFKQNAGNAARSKVKGLSMELTTLKNLIVNANAAKAEYASYIEEAEQMKKLGINE